MSDREGLSSAEMIRRAREAFSRPSTDPSFDEDKERSSSPSGDMIAARIRPGSGPAPAREEPSSRERIDRAGMPDVPIPEIPRPKKVQQPVPPRPSAPRPRRSTIPQPTDLIADAKTAAQDQLKRRGRGAFGTLVQVIIAGVLALIVLGIFAGDEEGSDNSPTVSEVPVTDVSAGTCFDDAGSLGSGTVTAVDCTEEHRFETIGSVVLAAGEYPGEEAGAEEAFDICLGAFEEYVGTNYATSIWWLDAAPPSESRWDGGDRVAHCYVFQLSGEEPIFVTGSAKSDGR